MTIHKPILCLFTFLFFLISCTEKPTPSPTPAEEKKAILQALNDETKAAFQRDYEGWTKKWVHDPTITKTYLNFPDSSFSESMVGKRSVVLLKPISKNILNQSRFHRQLIKLKYDFTVPVLG